MSHVDRMFVFGGSLACSSGEQKDDTWTLDLATLQWTRKDPTTGVPASSEYYYNMLADYDPNTQRVYLHNRKGKLYSYQWETNSYTVLQEFSGQALDVNAVIDPKRKLYLFIGGGDLSAYDIQPGSSYVQQNWKTQAVGCTGLINAVVPGLAYDPVQDRIVGWAGGDTIYLFDPDTKTCGTVVHPGGPGVATSNGTYGRFRYFPSLGVLALVNKVDQDAMVLRLTPPTGASDQERPIVVVTEPTGGTSLAGPTKLAAAATDNEGVAGVQFRLNGVAVGTELAAAPYEMTMDPATMANGDYQLTATAKDHAGNETISDPVLIIINSPDLTAPIISGVGVTSLTSSSATITWTTDEASDTQVEYGTTTAYGSVSPLDATAVTSHSVTLSGLQVSTLYHFRVKSKDAAGNESTSGDFTFTTAAKADTTAPVISGVTSTGITASGATITWTTDEPSDTQVEYGTTTAYGSSTPADGTMVASHSAALSGLQASTLYHFRVKSKDAVGNESTSGDFTFTTAAEGDTTAPVISGVTSTGITASGATIIWTTDEASDSQVEYGTTTAYGSVSPLDATAVTSHNVTLSSLQASTLYHFRVKSKDAAGNPATSADSTFTTLAGPDTIAPTVTLTAPAGGTSVSGTINVIADASDNIGVAGVQFVLDGSSFGAEDISAPFQVSWNTATASNGSHSLTAVARDAAGNRTTSSAVAITVTNTSTPITVTLTPVADAYVRSDNPTRNFGTTSELRVRLGNTSKPTTMRSYLKFTLNGLNGTVTEAKLRLWVTDGGTNRGSACSASNLWMETAITWNNAPAPGTLYVNGGFAPLGTWVEIVLPAGIFAAGNGDYSFVIAGGDTNRVTYSSRQGASPPHLVLTTSP